jgi:hypothetical protein
MNLMLFEIAKSANFTTEYLMSVEKKRQVCLLRFCSEGARSSAEMIGIGSFPSRKSVVEAIDDHV